MTCWDSKEPEDLARLGAPRSRDGFSSLSSQAQFTGRTANSGRDIDKDKSITAFTGSPAGGFGSGKSCQGREEELLAVPWYCLKTGGGPHGDNDTHGLTIILLTSGVCKMYSYPLGPPRCTRQEAKPRRKGQPREVKWLAQDHTALTGLSKSLTPSPDAQSSISPGSCAASLLRWSSVAELIVGIHSCWVESS